MSKTRSGFSKIFLLSCMLVAIHHCQADYAEEDVEDESTEDGTSLAAYEGQEESEMSEESYGLPIEQMLALHKKIDTNSDGNITMEEVRKFAHNMELEDALKYTAEQVKEIPVATSGKYTSNEILSFYGGYPNLPGEAGEKEKREHTVLDQQERHHVMFKVADQNSDGVLDEKELSVYYFPEHHDHALTAAAGYLLKKLDTNDDSQVSQAELARLDDGLEDIEHEFKQHDENGNGFLSLEELKPYLSDYHSKENELKYLFDAADVNGDNQISVAELQERHEELEDPALWFLSSWAEYYEL